MWDFHTASLAGCFRVWKPVHSALLFGGLQKNLVNILTCCSLTVVHGAKAEQGLNCLLITVKEFVRVCGTEIEETNLVYFEDRFGIGQMDGDDFLERIGGGVTELVILDAAWFGL